MPNQHKNKTISFRISENQRLEIEQRIKVSGLLKKDYYVRSCIYNRVCVVGKKENIYPLVEELRELYKDVIDELKRIDDGKLSNQKNAEYLEFVKALVWMLEGAEYLWK